MKVDKEIEAELDFSGRKKEQIRQEGKILDGITSKLKHEKFNSISQKFRHCSF